MTDTTHSPPQDIARDPDLRFETTYDWTVVVTAVGLPLGALGFMYASGNTSNIFLADGLFLKFALIPAGVLFYRALRVKLRGAPAIVIDMTGIHDLRGGINTVPWSQVRSARLKRTWYRLPVTTFNYLPEDREPDWHGKDVAVAGLIMTERSAAVLAAILHFKPELGLREDI
ncbi:MAG: hypothetical protein ACRC7G_02230 [Beijerinckiaceae bacterium]